MSIQLNQILGIEAGGEFEFIAGISQYVEEAVAPDVYAGATVFDGKAAYEALIADPAYAYNGPLTSGTAMAAKFRYTINNLASCLHGKSYEFVIILTDELI
jgi:hypothetical protein